MPDKNKVDDYYSQIQSDSSGKTADAKKKPKVVAKKKLVVKKKTTQEESSKKAVEKAPEKGNNRSGFQRGEQKPRPKKFVQKIEVVEGSKTQSSSSGFQKKTNTSTEKSDPKIQVRGAKQTEKKFHNNKKPFTNTTPEKDDTKTAAKPKGFKGERKTRGRFRDIDANLNKEVTFTRSNKIAKKQKEEKKVEDIKQNLVEKKGETIIVNEFLSLKELSEKLGIVLPKLIAEFMKNGVMVNINSKIDFDTASIIAEAFEIKLERDISAGGNTEDIVSGNIEELLKEDDSSKQEDRSPVISIMGHVDHGKTSLLDHIRQAKVASGEAGGITQSIGAYQVDMQGKKITFLDTPGHEAFTIMRARGAKSTDIAILVVAADEGVKPQTIESISHAREANIPVIVAINKMDKTGANPDHVKGQLAEHGLTPEDWGGDTPMIPVSAHSGFGIDDLLEMILLVAEMRELKANPNRNAIATVIESHHDRCDYGGCASE